MTNFLKHWWSWIRGFDLRRNDDDSLKHSSESCGAWFGEPKWHSVERCYGRKCSVCGKFKPHPWFDSPSAAARPDAGEVGHGA